MPSATESKHIALPKPAGLTKLPAAVHFPVEELNDERTQTLKRLLNEGHDATAPLREPNLMFHTHLPHLLGSAYRLGASTKLLQDAYDAETSMLMAADDTFVRGDKISRNEWRAFQNQKPYCVAYVDFFDSEVRAKDGDWQGVLQQYLYSTPDPLINGFVGGLGHPFIHLAYAYEFESAAVATEALSLGCTELDEVHKDLEHFPPDTSTYKTKSLADVVANVQNDHRLDGIFDQPGFMNSYVLTSKYRDILLEHWSAWEIDDPLQQLEQMCDLSTLLAIGTGNREKQYDFFLVHSMTVAHALLVLWHEFPAKMRSVILKQYAWFTLYVYIAQLRRPVNNAEISEYELNGRDWNWVEKTALAHEAALDAHFFKVVCAPRAFAQTYGEKDGFYLKAAVKFVTEFNGWVGFGAGVEGAGPLDA